jgi:hypothetical protein
MLDTHSTALSGLLRSGALDAVQLWLEKENKEESRRIGELKERQKQKQKVFEEQFKKRQEQSSGLSEHSEP